MAACRAVMGGFSLLAFLGASYMIRMPGRSYWGPLPPMSAEEAEIQRRLERHVRTLAGEIGERSMTRLRARRLWAGSNDLQ